MLSTGARCVGRSLGEIHPILNNVEAIGPQVCLSTGVARSCGFAVAHGEPLLALTRQPSSPTSEDVLQSAGGLVYVQVVYYKIANASLVSLGGSGLSRASRVKLGKAYDIYVFVASV